MARGRKQSAKIQAAVQQLTGNVKEPHFTVLTSDNLSLIKGLNYYATNSDFVQSKKWALEWVKVNMPESFAELKGKKDWVFANRGYVCRMIQNGFIMSDEQIEELKVFFNKAKKTKDVEVKEKAAPVVKKAPKEVFNVALEQFDYAVDRCLMGKEIGKVDFGVNPKDHAEVIKQIEKMTAEHEENKEYYDAGYIRRAKKFFKSVLDQLAVVKKVVKQQTVKTVAPRKIIPTKMAAGLKFKKEDPELGLVGLRPETLIGAQQAMVYDVARRFLMYFKAADETGLLIRGTTVNNFDTEKSIFKKVRKPEDVLKELAGKSIAQMRKVLAEIKSNQYGVNGRFNENMVILKV